jgi:hypothetical protein
MWTLAVPLLGADGLDALLARLPPRRRELAAALLVAALTIELLVTWRAENPSMPLEAAAARPAAAAWLAEHGRPGRFINDVHLPQPFHNSGLLWGRESAGGYNSLPLWRYLHLLWIANHGAVYPLPHIGHDLTAQGLWRFAAPIVDLLDVEWVVAPRDRPIDAPGFARVFAGPDGVDVWHNREALPRAFVVYRARVVDGEEAAAKAMAEADFAPARVAVVEKALPDVPPPDGDAPPPTHLEELFRTGPEDLRVTVDAARPGVLVVSEAWHPGWRATVDGQPAEILRVDYALRGLHIPTGRHVVSMWLVDEPLRQGGAISAAALALTVALLVVARRRRASSTAMLE